MTVDLLTNTAYGYPRGASRRVKPKLLACVHITGNPNEPADEHAQAERNYANRPDSQGPSAHDYINRDGSLVHAIETDYAAWSNGKLDAPNTALPLVQTVLSMVADGYNPNEAYVREVECCGRGAYPVTEAQLETVAQLIAADSIEWGIPISRETVGTHADLDSVNRRSCAFPASVREERLARLIERAQEIAEPKLYTQRDMDAVLAQLSAAEGEIAHLRADVAERDAEIVHLTETNLALTADLAEAPAIERERIKEKFGEWLGA